MTISKNTQIIDPFINQSILSTLNHVRNQVEFHCFAKLHTKWVDPFYGELCLIIAEVLVMNPDTNIKINGSLISTYIGHAQTKAYQNGPNCSR